jgi:hypothetical protein
MLRRKCRTLGSRNPHVVSKLPMRRIRRSVLKASHPEPANHTSNEVSALARELHCAVPIESAPLIRQKENLYGWNFENQLVLHFQD